MSSIPRQYGHGIASLRVLANHCYQDSGCKEQETEELFSEWNKVKFDLLKWKSHMPEPSVMQMDFTETPSSEFGHFSPKLVTLAEISISAPVTNA